MNSRHSAIVIIAFLLLAGWLAYIGNDNWGWGLFFAIIFTAQTINDGNETE